MKQNTVKWIFSLFWILLGLGLLVLGLVEVVDSFWSGMGSSLLVVGLLQMIRYMRLRKDQDYQEKVEVESKDERNRFIRNKAWAWAGYLFILVSAVAVIVLKALGQELLSVAASVAMGVMLVLYWVSYFLLRKKY